MKHTYRKYHVALQASIAAMFVSMAGAVTAASADAQNVLAAPAASFTDRVIVKYRDVVAPAHGAVRTPALSASRLSSAQRVGQANGLSLSASHVTGTGAQVIRLDRPVPVQEAQQIASQIKAQDPSVEYAEADLLLQRVFTPNDPRYAEQWHYHEPTAGIRVPGAWDKATGQGIRVAVLDTGYRPHVDLNANIVAGHDFISDGFVANDGDGRDADARDPGDWVLAGECGGGWPPSDESSSWHGTHVSGTVGALTNNGVGVAGVAFHAKIVPARVLGKCGGYTSDIADAIIWSSGGTVANVPANANPARVINMSLGGGGACGMTMQNAINSARSRGTVVVVAAGNANMDARNFTPANCQGVVAVASVSRNGAKAYYSNYGPAVDVAAPGGDGRGYILSTLNTGTTTPAADSYAFYQGTSMAAPHVAGIAALILSRNPKLTPDEVEALLKSTARPFPATCNGCGSGIVDATAAVNAVAVPTPESNEVEPNDSWSTAQAVAASGTVIQGSLSGTRDMDTFRVELPAGATLTATLTPNAGSDYDLYVYNSVFKQVGNSKNGTGQTETVTNANTGAATFTRYIRVIWHQGGTGPTDGTYSLKLSW